MKPKIRAAGYLAGNALKNLRRYGRRYLFWGVILLLLSGLTVLSLTIHGSPDADRQTADFTLRLGVVCAVLLAVMADTSIRMTALLRRHEIVSAMVSGADMSYCLAGYGLEQFLFLTGIWLSGAVLGIVMAVMFGYAPATSGIILRGLCGGILIIIIRLAIIYAEIGRKTPAQLLREET